MGSLKGKVAVVTGGGSGIGKGIALALAEEGVNTLLCGRRLAPLQSTAEAMERLGGKAIIVQADVSREEDVDAVMAAVKQFGDEIHFLINNAGISGGGPIHTHTIETWDTVMAINLRAPFLMARAVLPLMRGQKGGHIINISSESAMEHYPGNGAYGVSKHALNALGEYIQRENQDLGIRVDTICPGMVVTEMSQNAPGLDHSKSLMPEDVAELVLWLLSRRSNIKIGRPILIQTMENPWK